MKSIVLLVFMSRVGISDSSLTNRDVRANLARTRLW
jgi:hypothetical protein